MTDTETETGTRTGSRGPGDNGRARDYTKGGRRPEGPDGKTWEERHKRATHHWHKDILEAVAAEADASNRSKSQVVNDCVAKVLGVDAE